MSILKVLKLNFKFDQIAKDITTVLTGTVISQLLIVGGTLLFSRLYIPSQFAIFSVFFAVTSIIVQIINFRLEQSILVAHDEDVYPLLKLNIYITLIISCFYVPLINIISKLPFFKIKIETSSWVQIIMFAFYFIAASLWNITQCYLIRLGKYKIISTMAIIRSVLIVGITSFFPYFFGKTENGLIIGLVLGQILSTLIQFIYTKNFKNFSRTKSQSFFQTSKKLFSKYKSFPIVQFPSVLVETFSGQLPTFFFNTFYPSTILGYFAFSQRAINAPMDLVGGAIRTVFWEKAAKEYRKNNECASLFKQTFFKLLFIAVIPTLFLAIWGSPIFKFFFGSEWVMAGYFSSLLSFMLFFRFISSPLSSMFAIAHKQRYDLIIQIVILIIQYVLFFHTNLLLKNASQAIVVFGSVYSIKYLIELFFSYQFSKKKL